MSRYLLRRTIFAVGVSGVVLALGLLAGAGPAAAAAPSGLAVSPSQTPDPGWCAFLLWLTGRDICASLGSGPGRPADHRLRRRLRLPASAAAPAPPTPRRRRPPPPPDAGADPTPDAPTGHDGAAHDDDHRPAAHHGPG